MNQNQLLSVVLGRLKEGELIYTQRDPIYLNFHCCNPNYEVVNFHPRNLLKTRKAGLLYLLDLLMILKVSIRIFIHT